MGFFDGLSDRYRAWKAERRDKKQQEAAAAAQQQQHQQQQQQQHRQSSHDPRHTPSHHHAQQVSPVNGSISEDFFGDDFIRYDSQSPVSLRSSSSPVHPHAAYPYPPPQPSSSASSSSHSTPLRHPHSQQQRRPDESKESSDLPPQPAPQTDDERYAELLQQQEYLSFLEESGELTHEEAMREEQRVERELRRARRRERAASRAAAAGGSSQLSSPDHTPSPPIIEDGPSVGSASSSASSALASVHLRAAHALDSFAHHHPHPHHLASPHAYRPHAASSVDHRSSRPHHGVGVVDDDAFDGRLVGRPHALSASSSHSSHLPLPVGTPTTIVGTPSRSQSYSISHHHHHQPTPESINNTGSLTRAELHALPTFVYTISPMKTKKDPHHHPHSNPVSVVTTPEKENIEISVTPEKENLQTDVILQESILVPTDELLSSKLSVVSLSTVTTIAAVTLDSTSTDDLISSPASSDSDPSACCSICLCDFEFGDQLRALPCMHKYHRACVDDWLARSSCCPECNTNCRTAF